MFSGSTLVLGGGPAGLTAAYGLAKQGRPVTLLERDEGDEPFPDNWVYVHDPDVKVARIQNYRLEPVDGAGRRHDDGWLGGVRNLQQVGRNGLHRYNNSDHSMLTAMCAVENMAGAEFDLWSVNADSWNSEEQRPEEQPYLRAPVLSAAVSE